MTDTVVSPKNATIAMHPHPTGEKCFLCHCAKFHTWKEKGVRAFRLPGEKYAGLGFLMLQCKCGIWHMQPTGAEDAETIARKLREEG